MVVIANSTVKREDVASMMKGSTNDTGEEPLCPSRGVRQNCPCHACSPAEKINLMFMFPSALQRLRRHLLAVSAGSYVCCILQCSSDGRLIARLLSRHEVDSECPGDSFRSNDACAASPRAAAALGEATHTSRGAASRDSSGGEKIGRPGLRCCEPSAFLLVSNVSLSSSVKTVAFWSAHNLFNRHM